MDKSYKELLHNISTFVFDVDGVLTDGTVVVTTEGEMLRTMNVKDGYAIKVAIKQGYNVCVISGGTNEGVRLRLRGLGVTDIHMGAHHKIDPFDEYLDVYNIDPENVLYMGDDIPDIPPMKLVGVPSCPQNAVAEVKDVCKYISHKKGGDGCVRDVIEQVLKVRGHWAHNFSAKND